ncbi:hypothetical protein A2763_04690 [Candidatus Kaiserbacteria bacterium RIFCSPHIGHO2_01_FULL_54_36]|uniref:Uncharacterized protein n=1 Tax=Candidatus Kaiserbacteria bacterium RIFCSPHIGHO2_01_FULL_54_36 TaxID=1798482 RepID=A0A1F6CLZ4_9BACT|nr:MAG: hypothetical protein A2763_04690 [Candidatus Kaiserbacteria bacterium RIFCSPHIGHO2_01_FULL_54_36]OGG75065.1 MAG: hypothetical protein A3A41_02120 [Candidatus Kaiserbacteria bacterium RIFCSPLOWO2_01_FULL_54_22]
MFKNWKAICKVESSYLRLLMLTASEPELAKLQRGFPELFQEEKPEHPGPFPLSFLRKIAEDLKADCFQGDPHPTDAWCDIANALPNQFHDVGLPSEFCVHPDHKDNFSAGHRLMSAELIKAYSKLHKGYQIDMIFPWGLRIVHWDGVPYFLGDFDHCKSFLVYPAALVDVNS